MVWLPAVKAEVVQVAMSEETVTELQAAIVVPLSLKTTVPPGCTVAPEGGVMVSVNVTESLTVEASDGDDDVSAAVAVAFPTDSDRGLELLLLPL